jgi:hypothetical protein
LRNSHQAAHFGPLRHRYHGAATITSGRLSRANRGGGSCGWQRGQAVETGAPMACRAG